MEGMRSFGIEFVLAKHENCAGFIAEGGFHADGVPGILVAMLGPGVANAVNVVANAFQDRVPLIFLTGCIDNGETFRTRTRFLTTANCVSAGATPGTQGCE